MIYADTKQEVDEIFDIQPSLMVRLGLPGILVESFTFQEHTNCFRGAGYVQI